MPSFRYPTTTAGVPHPTKYSSYQKWLGRLSGTHPVAEAWHNFETYLKDTSIPYEKGAALMPLDTDKELGPGNFFYLPSDLHAKYFRKAKWISVRGVALTASMWADVFSLPPTKYSAYATGYGSHCGLILDLFKRANTPAARGKIKERIDAHLQQIAKDLPARCRPPLFEKDNPLT